MLNYVSIMGRMVRNPELKQTQSGIPVTNFTLAVDRDFFGKDGGEKETDFIDVVCWRNTAEFVNRYFSKGRMAIVAGRLQMRKWTDKNGNNRVATEVVAENVYFGDSKREESGGGTGYPYTGTDSGYQRNKAPSNVAPSAPDFDSANGFDMNEDSEDDLPF